MPDLAAIAAALRSLSFERESTDEWVSADHHIGAVACPAGVFVGWCDVAWAGPASPVSILRDVRHVPGAFLERPEDELADAIADVRESRAAAVHSCVRCGIQYVPGHMHDRLCHGCAERETGIVH